MRLRLERVNERCCRPGPGWRLLQHHQQAHHHREERGTLHKGSGEDRTGAQIVGGFRLAGHGLNGVTADATDAETGTKSGDARANGCNTVTGANFEKC